MPTIGTSSKPAYVYDAGTDTWIPIGPGEHTHAYVEKSTLTTTGDLVYASSANTPARLGIGSTGQVLTVSGGVPAWSAVSAPTAQAVACDKNVGQVITSGGYTALIFDNELIDTDGFHSTSSNTSRLTVPAGLGGKYLVNVVLYVNPVNINGDFVAKLQVNGNDKNRWSVKVKANEPFAPSFSSIISLNATDYVEVLCYQNTGSNMTVDSNQYGQFAMFRIGA